jgi:hypothetical protein
MEGKLGRPMMPENENNPVKTKAKRFRSPPYPLLDLGKAVARANAMFEKAHHYDVGVDVLMESWKMESAEGKVWRHVAALIQYGLVSDSGTGKTRKFKITDTGRRLIQDKDPSSEKRVSALKTAFLGPMIHKELFEKYGAASGLSDSVLKTYLTIDRSEKGDSPYSSGSADEVIQTYRSSLAYAGIVDSDTVPAPEIDMEADKQNHEYDADKEQGNTVKVGDFVQWTSNGVDQFNPPRKVEFVAPDGGHVRVFGSPTGIKMSDVTVVEKPALTPPPAAVSPQPMGTNPPFTVYQVGGRLQITADVDAAGLKKLQTLLSKYEEILTLMN